MKRNRERQLGVFALAIAVIVLTCLTYGIWSVYRRTKPPAHVFSIDPAVRLTEDVAIAYTRRALVVEGKDKPLMRPIPYWPESQFTEPEAERLFARNTLDPNKGYVIWNVGFHVQLDRNEDQVTCQVFTPK